MTFLNTLQDLPVEIYTPLNTINTPGDRPERTAGQVEELEDAKSRLEGEISELQVRTKSDSTPLSSESGTCKTVKARFRPGRSGKNSQPLRGVLSWLGSGNTSEIVSQRVFIKLFCISQFPHKSVNLSFIIVIIRDELTNLCGN